MKLDINNEYHQLIIGACANLIVEERYTAKEVIELLENAKSDLWDAPGSLFFIVTNNQ